MGRNLSPCVLNIPAKFNIISEIYSIWAACGRETERSRDGKARGKVDDDGLK